MVIRIIRFAVEGVLEFFGSVGVVVASAGNQSQTKVSFRRRGIEVGGFGQKARRFIIVIQVIKRDAEIVEHFKGARQRRIDALEDARGTFVLLVLRQRRAECEQSAWVCANQLFDEIGSRVCFLDPASAISDVQKSERQLRIIGRDSARRSEVLGGFGEFAGIAVQRAEIVMRLHVPCIELQHALELGDGFSGLAVLGQHATEIVVGADEIRIELDGCIEFRKRLLGAARAIQYDAENIVRNGRTRRSLHGGARRAFGIN